MCRHPARLACVLRHQKPGGFKNAPLHDVEPFHFWKKASLVNVSRLLFMCLCSVYAAVSEVSVLHPAAQV